MAAPQLPAGLEGPELCGKGDGVTGLDWPSSSGKLSRGTDSDREGAGCGWALGQTLPGRQEGPIQPEPHTSTSSTPPQVPVASSNPTEKKVPATAHTPLLSPPRPPFLSCRGHSVAEQGPGFEAVMRLGLLMPPKLCACRGLGGSCQSSPDPAAPRKR